MSGIVAQLGLGFGSSGAGGPQADPPLSIGNLITYGTDGLPEPSVTIYIQLREGPGTEGYSLDSTILAVVSGVGGVIAQNHLRLSGYRARRGLNGKWHDYDVPDAGSFTMPEVLGAP